MKRGFCKSRTPTSKAQTGTKRVHRSLPVCRTPEKPGGLRTRFSTTAAFFYRVENVRNGFCARFGAKIAFAVDADTDGVGFHIAFSDHEHGVHLDLLGALNFTVDLVGAVVDLRA